MKKLLTILILIVLFGSCRAKYYMPNDTLKKTGKSYKRNGQLYKWYESRKPTITKTVHHPRWANNYKK